PAAVPSGPTDPVAMVVGTDAGVPTQVGVYDSHGNEEFAISPFGSSFTGGARVTPADVTGDGAPDVIVGSGAGIRARVRIWDGASRQLIFDETPFNDFTGGVVVAAGDLNGDGVADLVIGPDVGGGPRIHVWDGKTLSPMM